MKKESLILFLLIVSLILSTGFIKKAVPVKHEVEITFTGFTALYGTPKDCGLFKPDTVILKGLLSGNENVDRYDPVMYTGVLHLSIKMAVCSVKRVNGEDQFCTMTVNGNGPVYTELEIDTAAGYGYIKIHHDPSLGTFTKKVSGTCDHQEMIEEENNVPDNSIAAIFNGRELTCLKDSPKLRSGKTYTEKGPGGEIVLKVR
jgi:hypothetical protein